MAEPRQDGLTDDQAAVYDRQLRVWGVEVQKKLTAARVLIVGFGQLAAEIAKNIVLAGVGAVALMDDAPASSFAGANFLVTSASDPASSAAEAGAKTLQAMNPLVRVAVERGAGAAALAAAPPAELAAVLARYDLVVATRAPLGALRALDAAAAAAGVKFMAADVRGTVAFYFANLGRHEFVPKASGGKTDDAAATAQVLEYAPLSVAFGAPPSARPANAHPLYPVLQAALAFEDEHGRPPAAGDADAVRAALERAAEAASAAPPPDAALALLPSFLGAAEFAPLAAIAGGVVANDVVRAVSGSGAPLKNFFFFSLADGRGVVEDMPPPAAAAPKAVAAAAKGSAPAAVDVIEL